MKAALLALSKAPKKSKIRPRPPPRPSSSVAGGKKRKDEEDDEMKKIREYSLLNRMVKFAAAWFVARHYFASLEAKLRLAASRFRVMNAFLSVPS